jgi:TPP-dependent 2-oxoacid decarboxylase
MATLVSEDYVHHTAFGDGAFAAFQSIRHREVVFRRTVIASV